LIKPEKLLAFSGRKRMDIDLERRFGSLTADYRVL
jgi:hypothetical protein